MKKILLLVFAFVALPLYVWAGFEGIMTMTFSDAQKDPRTMRAKIFSEGNKFRMDMNMPGNAEGEASYMMDGDKNRTISVMHSRKMYMTLSQKDPEDGNFFMKPENRNIEKAREKGYTVKEVGKEKIEGFQCRVYEITGQAKHDLKEAKAWFADELDGFMIKMDGRSREGNHYKMTLTEIQKKKLSEAVFEPPAGYKEFQQPQMAGMDPSSMAQEMQRIQSLPPAERQREMQKFQERMQKRAQEMQTQAASE